MTQADLSGEHITDVQTDKPLFLIPSSFGYSKPPRMPQKKTEPCSECVGKDQLGTVVRDTVVGDLIGSDTV